MNDAAKLLGFEFAADEFVRLVPKPIENTAAINILNEIIAKHGDSQPKTPPDVGEVYRIFMSVAPRMSFFWTSRCLGWTGSPFSPSCRPTIRFR